MKALMLSEYRQLDYIDYPVPEPGPEDVLIQVKSCGICGSDIHGYDGSSGRRIPPLIMGHELSGVVARVGERVTGWTAGQRVTCESMVSCGRCFFCRRGEYNLCENLQVLGVSTGEYRRHGGFAEYLVVPQRILYELPEEISYSQGTLVEPLAIALHAINLTPLKENDSAVVVGAGMVGLLVIQALRAAGCGQIIAVDIDPDRLRLAQQLGAGSDILSNDASLPQKLLEQTGGRGADRVFEVVGNSPAFNTALACARKGGSVTLVGNLSPRVDFPLQSAVMRQLTLYGSCSCNGEYPAVIEMLRRGKISTGPLISALAPLEEGAAWFDRLYRREPGLMKVILEP